RALDRLEANSGVAIAYSPTLVPVQKLVSCHCREATVKEAMEALLEGTGFEAFALTDQILVRRRSAPYRDLRRAPSFAGGLLASRPALTEVAPHVDEPGRRRVGTITGQVTDASTLRPLSGAQVFIPSLNIGTLTQANGRYVLLNVPAGSHRLEVSLIGYASANQQITVADGEQGEVNFALHGSAISLDEVVV